MSAHIGDIKIKQKTERVDFMVRVLENINDNAYKMDIISTITETQDLLNNIKNAVKKSGNTKNLDSLSVSFHELYDNTIDIFLKCGSLCD